MSKIKLVCPTCSAQLSNCREGETVECPSCGMTVRALATTKTIAQPVNQKSSKPKENERERDPLEKEPLLAVKDNRPLKLSLTGLGWFTLALGAIDILVYVFFRQWMGAMNLRPFLLMVAGLFFLLVGGALLWSLRLITD